MSRQPFIANPVSLLRDHILSNKPIKQKSESLYFENAKLPLKYDTRYLFVIQLGFRRFQ